MQKSVRSLYWEKLTSADEAVKNIKTGDYVCCALTVGEPPALLQAIADHIEIFSDVKIMQMTPCRQYAYLKPENTQHVKLLSWFTGADREAVNQGWADFIPLHFQDTCAFIREGFIPVDTFITAVSPMDEHGFFSLGATVAYSLEALQKARTVILEVNENMPYVYGNTLVHISQVDHIIENHVALPQFASREPDQIQKAIGAHIAELVDDGSTLQLGLGGIPMAMADYLQDKHDLGVHSGSLVDAMVDLFACGAINNSQKSVYKGKMIGTCLIGTDKIYKFCHQNSLVELHPVDYTHAQATLAANHKMVSVNAALEVDLFGQCISETIGTDQYSGTGGQADFVRGVVKSPGGKSILALPSTVKDNTVSTLIPYIQNGEIVSVTRNDVDYIVTEYGAVRLRGKSRSQRALALISIAHPHFKDELKYHARRMNLI